MADDISTDEILSAEAKVLPHRSNIQRTDDFSLEPIDPTYLERARAVRDSDGHAVIPGKNYGQGSPVNTQLSPEPRQLSGPAARLR